MLCWDFLHRDDVRQPASSSNNFSIGEAAPGKPIIAMRIRSVLSKLEASNKVLTHIHTVFTSWCHRFRSIFNGVHFWCNRMGGNGYKTLEVGYKKGSTKRPCWHETSGKNVGDNVFCNQRCWGYHKSRVFDVDDCFLDVFGSSPCGDHSCILLN